MDRDIDVFKNGVLRVVVGINWGGRRRVTREPEAN